MLFILNVNLFVFYLSAVEELCFAFCCTCERILQEPRARSIWKEIHFQKGKNTRVMGFNAASPCLCFVLLDFLMLFILFGVKIKNRTPLVLFDTPAVFAWGEG